MSDVHDLIILGSGPAGWTAAVYAARANLSPVLITGSETGGQLTKTTDVDNWPADCDGVQGPDLMERFQRHAERFGTTVIYDHIERVGLSDKPVKLYSGDDVYQSRSLIIATGAQAKYLGLESESRYMSRGVSACAVCDGFFYRDKPVAVVGGGNTAVEEALFLSDIASSVLLVHRRETFRAEEIMQAQLFSRVNGGGKIKLCLSAEVEEIVGNEEGVTALRTVHKDGSRQTHAVEGVFIAIGHRANTDPFVGSLKMKDGYIITRGGSAGMSTETSVTGVFAAGDVQDSVYRQAVTSAASGCMAALDAKSYLQHHDQQ